MVSVQCFSAQFSISAGTLSSFFLMTTLVRSTRLNIRLSSFLEECFNRHLFGEQPGNLVSELPRHSRLLATRPVIQCVSYIIPPFYSSLCPMTIFLVCIPCLNFSCLSSLVIQITPRHFAGNIMQSHFVLLTSHTLSCFNSTMKDEETLLLYLFASHIQFKAGPKCH